MDFRIADTFTGSLARLTAEEQKAVKTTAFDLQLNPESPGHHFHRVERARDRNFWSVRVSGDVRLIVHRTPGSLLLCYVDHHDKAYAWAERRRLDTHPRTGAAQLVEIREKVVEIVRQMVVREAPREAASGKPVNRPLSRVAEADLLEVGVPQEWIPSIQQADEDEVLEIATRLPAEASEAVLEIAVCGGAGSVSRRRANVEDSMAAAGTGAVAGGDPFQHPDAQRRFRTISSLEELERAFEFPWDRWMVFLHPEQRRFVDRNYNGPARVSGSAGTGKTVVAIHRAAHLARGNPEARVLLTTFSAVLANALKENLRRLLANEPRLAERIEVHSVNAIANRLYKAQFGAPANLVPHRLLDEWMAEAARCAPTHRFSAAFLRSEWEHVITAWGIRTWEAYRDSPRIGRKSRLSEERRAVLWEIFGRVLHGVESGGYHTVGSVYGALAARFAGGAASPFDHVIVDEAQDMGIAQLRFFAAVARSKPNGLFFTGDIAQRIFQPAFSWASVGVDIRGRSRVLRVNYRTSHQIRRQADRLLEPEISDAEGQTERRNTTVSVFNGPEPMVRLFEDLTAEGRAVAQWIRDRIGAGIAPQEIGVFVRSNAEMSRAESAIRESGLRHRVFDDSAEVQAQHVAVGTMHHAKGLEFKAVAVMACDEGVIPSQERIGAVGDQSDLQEVYETERHLLYVACTRARDFLLLTGITPGSEFLADML